MKVPDRWLNYSPHSKIGNTKFVACKVPLPQEKCNLTDELRFTPEDLLKSYPNIKLVIDLTYTSKYYNGHHEFVLKGIKHVKLKCKGHEIPSESIYKSFRSTVNNFLAENRNDELIGVHCTHGINRTGYFICRYMVEELGYSSEESLHVFGESRGHAMERTVYINAIMKLGRHEVKAKIEKSVRSDELDWRSSNFRKNFQGKKDRRK